MTSKGEFAIALLVAFSAYIIGLVYSKNGTRVRIIHAVNKTVIDASYKVTPRVGDFICIPPDPKNVEFIWEVIGISQLPVEYYDWLEVYAIPVDQEKRLADRLLNMN